MPTAAMISLLQTDRALRHVHYNGKCIISFPHECVSSYPTQTRLVTPRPPELHFYLVRHVRDRVRLHLRRVTEDNNTENEGDEYSPNSRSTGSEV
ncbi:hypothetical protein QQF64_001033 [Cirrhinus molitorella]|uniref:DET1- and DDB1-associated protein 1 n=1 Tax=Cirrhinus molitorella TaxID=172907 RepID=A0ABR3NZC3_9TELE